MSKISLIFVLRKIKHKKTFNKTWLRYKINLKITHLLVEYLK